MDPNETLRQLRENVAAALKLADEYEKDPDPPSYEDGEHYLNVLDEIAQQFQALDEWLTRGGFPPAAWARQSFTPGQVRTVIDEVQRDPEPLGPPNPAHASTELMDQLDRDLAHAGEVVRRMRGER